MCRIANYSLDFQQDSLLIWDDDVDSFNEASRAASTKLCLRKNERATRTFGELAS